MIKQTRAKSVIAIWIFLELKSRPQVGFDPVNEGVNFCENSWGSYLTIPTSKWSHPIEVHHGTRRQVFGNKRCARVSRAGIVAYKEFQGRILKWGISNPSNRQPHSSVYLTGVKYSQKGRPASSTGLKFSDLLLYHF